MLEGISMKKTTQVWGLEEFREKEKKRNKFEVFLGGGVLYPHFSLEIF